MSRKQFLAAAQSFRSLLIVEAALEDALDLIAQVRAMPNGKSVRIFYCVIEADLKKMMIGSGQAPTISC